MKIIKISHLNKLSAEMRGEWWIIGGQALFADGDTGDINHEGMVIDSIWEDHEYELKKIVGDKIVNNRNLYEIEDEQLVEAGLTKEEIAVLNDKIDARDYGMQHLGWKRVKGNNVQTDNFENEDLNDIVHGLNSILDDTWQDNDEEPEVNIEVTSTRTMYLYVPLEVLQRRDFSEINQYRTKYAKTKIFKICSDENISQKVKDYSIYEKKGKPECFVWIIDKNGELLSRRGEMHQTEFGDLEWDSLWRGRFYPETNNVHIYIPWSSKISQDYYKRQIQYSIYDIPDAVLKEVKRVYGEKTIKLHAKSN